MKTQEVLILCLIGLAIQLSISEAKKKSDPAMAGAQHSAQQVDGIDQPERPIVFKNKAELMSYLKKLNEYYAVVGRPRFGKRGYSGENFDEEVESTNDDDQIDTDQYVRNYLRNRYMRRFNK